MATSELDKSDPLLTMDIVREFMLSKGGKIQNQELVDHFRTFLNDPVRKVANREKIKIFVNTLAIVKLDASGQKLITLKKKYRESGNFDGDPTVDATPSTPSSKTKSAVKKSEEGEASKPKEPKELSQKSQSFDSLSEKTVQVEGSEDYVLISKNESKSKSVDIPDKEDEVECGPSDPFRSPVPAQNFATSKPDSMEETVDEEPVVVAESTRLTEATKPEEKEEEEEDAVVSTAEEVVEEKQTILTSSPLPPVESQDENDGTRRPFLAPSDPVTTPKSSSISEAPTSGSLSVKDVAKSLNKMESDNQSRPLAAKNKRENRKAPTGDDVSGDYNMTFTELDRDWLMAAANCDYMTMMKMLQSNPQLAKQRDFITGYAPLHWAAKHGKPDVIKLLCGNGAVANVRTSGGYTPLHLAAMQNHESIVELLIGYGADPSIRDYSGRKPKQWLQAPTSARMSQMLQARRTNHGGSTTPVDGPACDTAIGKAMFLGLGAMGLKTALGKENAPLPRPISTSRDEHELMPPPSALPMVLRAKPVQRQKDVHSDSEMASPQPHKKMQGSDSSPNVGTIV